MDARGGFVPPRAFFYFGKGAADRADDRAARESPSIAALGEQVAAFGCADAAAAINPQTAAAQAEAIARLREQVERTGSSLRLPRSA